VSYQCFVPGCPAQHESKYQVCEAKFSKKCLTFNEAFDQAQKAAMNWLPMGTHNTAMIREIRNGYAYGYAAALLAASPSETSCSGWQPLDTRPKEFESTYLVTNGLQVAPWIRGIIHNNAGTAWDWEYGSNIIGWMPLPSPLKTSTEPGT
jgi:hypothetical protein